jgi:streptogramin lyase
MFTQLIRRAMVVAVIVIGLSVTLPRGASAAVTGTTFPTGANGPGSLTVGPDGNMYFTDAEDIGRITPAGVITNFISGQNATSTPVDSIVAGPDGNLWFCEDGVGVSGTPPSSIVAGPAGELWFLIDGTTAPIGRITTAGAITEITSGLNSMSEPNALTAGPDGNLWFTDPDNGATPAVGMLTPIGTSVQEFATGTGTMPNDITAGPDGNVWFDDQYSGQYAVGRATPGAAPTLEEFNLDTQTPWTLGFGADGNLWVPQTGEIARVRPAGAVSEITSGLAGVGQDGDQIVAGPDGNIWYDDGATKSIVRVDLDRPPLATTGTASAVTESGATIAGTVTPLSSVTTVTVSYGTTTAMSSSASAGTLGAGTKPQPVSAALTGLPAGTIVYYKVTATNAAGAASGAMQRFTTGAERAKAPPLTPTIGTAAFFADVRLLLRTPSPQFCVAAGARLAATLTATKLPGSSKADRFLRATFTIDKGLVRKRRETVRVHGHLRHKVVTVHVVNATARRLPAAESLKLTGLKAGLHRLRVKVFYRETVKHRKVTRSTTLSVQFRVC